MVTGATVQAFTTGATSLAGGGAFTGSTSSRSQRITEERLRYKALFIRDATIEEAEGEAEILYESDNFREQIRGRSHTQLNQTTNHLAAAQFHYISFAKATSQSKQLLHEGRINRANQASWAALAAMGGAQITDATYTLNNVVSPVANVISGFSIASSVFALGAAGYGLWTTVKQLAENQRMQETITTKWIAIDNMHTGEDPRSPIELLKDYEKTALTLTLKKLQAEEELLIQQRNSNAINFIAALLSIAATVLVLTGTTGIALGLLYYALLGSSILLPLIAIGYATFSMNEKKYTQALYDLLMTADRLPEYPYVPNKCTVEHLKNLLVILLNSEMADNEKIDNLYSSLHALIKQLQEPEKQSDPEAQATQRFRIEQCIESLHRLLRHLEQSKERWIVEEIVCKLKINGMQVKQLRENTSSTQLVIARKEMLSEVEDGRTPNYAYVASTRKKRNKKTHWIGTPPLTIDIPAAE